VRMCRRQARWWQKHLLQRSLQFRLRPWVSLLCLRQRASGRARAWPGGRVGLSSGIAAVHRVRRPVAQQQPAVHVRTRVRSAHLRSPPCVTRSQSCAACMVATRGFCAVWPRRWCGGSGGLSCTSQQKLHAAAAGWLGWCSFPRSHCRPAPSQACTLTLQALSRPPTTFMPCRVMASRRGLPPCSRRAGTCLPRGQARTGTTLALSLNRCRLPIPMLRPPPPARLCSIDSSMESGISAFDQGIAVAEGRD